MLINYFMKKKKEKKEEKEKKEKEEIIFSNKLICLIGPSSVGKTSFFKVYRNEEIKKFYSSMGIDLYSNKDDSIKLVDTSGNMEYFEVLVKDNDIIQRCHIFLYLYNDVPKTYEIKTINQYIDNIKLGKEELAKKNGKKKNKIK